ncbi:hypothetical protein M422DRAFT_249875 [Sphaerobolus stellatus SS14]|uniref:Uncharacterized protein n=1 Tax=Sphaerobolus stellatus (strain SS14) TaxID=990650 RepID=A0A0C9UUH4_SPHS4|nr:hypothetical protein M422DRAFT_249875 [Sphaerobolus stellatus SS14]
MAGLRDVLKWKGGIDPSLIDLHPSLANADRAKHIINSLRDKRYPDGTGFEAALKLLKQHQKLPPDEAYIRVIERHIIPGECEFLLVVCMFKSMSELLAHTSWLTIDTSFKRVWGWQEFEMEVWFPEHECSVVVAHAFTNSKSGEAHLILFERIFDVMKQDTGIEVRFRHIHGEGIDTVTADQHKGQTLGLGKFCQKLCCDRPGYCTYNHTCPLHELSPYEHLAHFYQLCFQHYSTKVHDLCGHVSENIHAAMMSLASAEPLTDLPETLDLIQRQGGKKGNDWLNDKLAAEGFALAGICRQRSLIPVKSWKAAPNTTNGNEQAHRDANRDGKNLINITTQTDIPVCDNCSTDFEQACRAIIKSSQVQKRAMKDTDKKLEATYLKLITLQRNTDRQVTALKRVMEEGKDEEGPRKQLKTAQEGMTHLLLTMKGLEAASSGNIPKPLFTVPDVPSNISGRSHDVQSITPLPLTSSSSGCMATHTVEHQGAVGQSIHHSYPKQHSIPAMKPSQLPYCLPTLLHAPHVPGYPHPMTVPHPVSMRPHAQFASSNCDSNLQVYDIRQQQIMAPVMGYAPSILLNCSLPYHALPPSHPTPHPTFQPPQAHTGHVHTPTSHTQRRPQSLLYPSHSQVPYPVIQQVSQTQPSYTAPQNTYQPSQSYYTSTGIQYTHNVNGQWPYPPSQL